MLIQSAVEARSESSHRWMSMLHTGRAIFQSCYFGVGDGIGEIGEANVAVGVTDGGGNGEETVAVGVGVTGEVVGVGVPTHPPTTAITITMTHSTRRIFWNLSRSCEFIEHIPP